MRTLLAGLLALSACALGEAEADPPERFTVPEMSRAPSDGRGDVPTHEVILPADVVARPGESPSEALARALRADESDLATDRSTAGRVDRPRCKEGARR